MDCFQDRIDPGGTPAEGPGLLGSLEAASAALLRNQQSPPPFAEHFLGAYRCLGNAQALSLSKGTEGRHPGWSPDFGLIWFWIVVWQFVSGCSLWLSSRPPSQEQCSTRDPQCCWLWPLLKPPNPVHNPSCKFRHNKSSAELQTHSHISDRPSCYYTADSSIWPCHQFQTHQSHQAPSTSHYHLCPIASFRRIHPTLTQNRGIIHFH